MVSVVAALTGLGCSVLGGVSTGVLVAATTRGEGIRARAFLRAHGRRATWCAGCMTLVFSVGVLAGVLSVEYNRVWLGLTCLAAMLLLTVATWLVLIETDEDDDPDEAPDDPAWWPEFERELREWARNRVPAGRS